MSAEVHAQAERVRQRRLAVAGMRFDDPFAARAFASLLAETDDLLRLIERERDVASTTRAYVGHVAARSFPRAES